MRLTGVEAAGEGLHGRHGAPLGQGSPGVLHGSYSYLLQDAWGQVAEAHSISAGLDYPGVGPEHSLAARTRAAPHTRRPPTTRRSPPSARSPSSRASSRRSRAPTPSPTCCAGRERRTDRPVAVGHGALHHHRRADELRPGRHAVRRGRPRRRQPLRARRQGRARGRSPLGVLESVRKRRTGRRTTETTRSPRPTSTVRPCRRRGEPRPLPRDLAPRLTRAFAAPRAGRAALIPYLTGGHPDPETSDRLVDTVIDAGADIVELGVPFSDPIADGPVVQRSTHAALAAGVTPDDVMQLAAAHSARAPVRAAHLPQLRAGLRPGAVLRARGGRRRGGARDPRPAARRGRRPERLAGAAGGRRAGGARRRRRRLARADGDADQHRARASTSSPPRPPRSSTASPSPASPAPAPRSAPSCPRCSRACASARTRRSSSGSASPRRSRPAAWRRSPTA